MNVLANVRGGVREADTSLHPVTMGRRSRRRTPPCATQAMPILPGRLQPAKAVSPWQRSRSQSVRPDFKRLPPHAADAYADEAKRHFNAMDHKEIQSGDYPASEAFSTLQKSDRILRHSLKPHRQMPLRKAATSRAASPRRIELDRLSLSSNTARHDLELVEKLKCLEKSVKK